MKSKKIKKSKTITHKWLTIPFDAMLRFLERDRSLLPWLDCLLREHQATFAGAGYDALRLRFAHRGYSVDVLLYLTYRSEGPQAWRLATDFVDQDVTNDNGVVAPKAVIERLEVRVQDFASALDVELSEGIYVSANALTKEELEQALEMGED
jgi:hypothetical protein